MPLRPVQKKESIISCWAVDLEEIIRTGIRIRTIIIKDHLQGTVQKGLEQGKEIDDRGKIKNIRKRKEEVHPKKVKDQKLIKMMMKAMINSIKFEK